MDVAALRGLIETALKTEPCVLSGDALGSGSIRTLFAAFLDGAALTLTGAKELDPQNEVQVVVLGTLAQSLLGLRNLSATAAFTVVNGAAEVVVALTQLPGGWTPSDAFPALRNSLADAFDYAAPRLTLDSQKRAALPDNFQTAYGLAAHDEAFEHAFKPGLSLDVTLTLKDQQTVLGWLLAIAPLTASGPIEPNGNAVRMRLMAKAGGSIRIGSFDLAFDQHLIALALPNPAGPPVMTTFIRLEADLEPQKTSKPLPITVSATLFSLTPGLVNFEGLPGGDGGLSFDDIPALIEKGDLSGKVPGELPALSDIKLQRIDLMVDLASRKLVNASATVVYSNPTGLKAFDGLISFEEMAVTFAIVDPIGLRLVEATIAGKAVLAGGTIDAELVLPEIRVVCALEEGTSIDVKEIVRSIAGSKIDMPSVTCTQLKVFGDVKQSAYRLQAEVKDDWTFHLGSVPLAITDFGFDLQKNAQGISGEAIGNFSIANTTLFVSTEYDAASAGWIFKGGTLGTQAVSVSALVKDAVNLFGGSLPSAFPAITLTSLAIGFDSSTGEFTFTCDTTFNISGVLFDVNVTIDSTKSGPNPGITIDGDLMVKGADFTVHFDTSGAGTAFTASWSDPTTPLGVEEIADVFGLAGQLPIPDGLDLSLTSASFTYDSGAGGQAVAFTAASKNYGAVALATDTDGTTRFFAAGITIADLELSKLPLVGDHLPSSVAIGLRNLQIWIVPTALTPAAVSALSAALAGHAQLPSGLAQGAAIGGNVALGQASYPFSAILGSASQAATAGQAAGQGAGQGAQQTGVAPSSPASGSTAPAASTAPGSAKWIDVQKGLGPLWFSRVGIQYSQKKLFVLLDASVTLAGLTLDLLGLGVGSSLTDFSPVPHLDGLGLSFKGDALQISGELLSVPQGPSSQEEYEYDGAATITTPEFSIGALCSYAKLTDGTVSLFLFAFLDAPLGGPSFFFVTGLAGGLGYNRAVTIPAPDQVQNFPLVAFVTGTQPVAGATVKQQFASALTALTAPVPKVQPPRAYIYPAPGEYWVAAGVRFTSFEIINSFVLLLVEFGKEFEIAVLGLSKIQLPAQVAGAVPPVVYAELALEVVILPSDGIIRATAELTPNSWVLDTACRLTGGFAFYAWFAGDHKGDFVVTLGGYLPSYTVPDHYPRVPRLGLNWPLGNLKVGGNVYFALTPSCVMAGGRLSAVYQSGNLRAWFDAQADFLVTWKPFTYDIAVNVTIGAAYTLRVIVTKTLSVELNVSLHLWGPPFGGRATVNWYVLSFTIAFGAGGRPPNDPVDWPHFSASFLPQPPAAKPVTPRAAAARLSSVADAPVPAQVMVGANITGGLVRTTDDGTWIVKAGSFAFVTQTAVPATRVTFNSAAAVPAIESLDKDGNPIVLGIRPMAVSKIASIHKIEIARTDGGKGLEDLTSWRREAVPNGSPSALWATTPLDGAPQSGSQEVIADTIVGVRLTAAADPASLQGPPPMASDDVGRTRFDDAPLPLDPGPVGVDPVTQPTDPLGQLASSVMDQQHVVGYRSEILQAMRSAGAGVTTTVDLSLLKSSVAQLFVGSPTFGMLGTVPQAVAAAAPPAGSSAAPASTYAAPAPMPLPTAAPQRVTPDSEPRVVAAFRQYARAGQQPGPGAEPDAGARRDRVVTGVTIDADVRATQADVLHLRSLTRATQASQGPQRTTRLHPGATMLWTLPRGDASERTISVDGSLPVRVAVFDRHHLPLADVTLAADRQRSERLPRDAARFAVTALASTAVPGNNAPAGAAGWRADSSLIQVNPIALLGDGVILRPQRPLVLRRRGRSTSHGLTSVARLLEHNRIAHGLGGRPRGWIETFLPSAVRSVWVSARPDDGSARTDAASAVTVWLVRDTTATNGATVESVALQAQPGTSPGAGLLYELPMDDRASAAAFTRVRVQPHEGWLVDGVAGIAAGAGAVANVRDVRWQEPAALTPGESGEPMVDVTIARTPHDVSHE